MHGCGDGNRFGRVRREADREHCIFFARACRLFRPETSQLINQDRAQAELATGIGRIGGERKGAAAGENINSFGTGKCIGGFLHESRVEA